MSKALILILSVLRKGHDILPTPYSTSSPPHHTTPKQKEKTKADSLRKKQTGKSNPTKKIYKGR